MSATVRHVILAVVAFLAACEDGRPGGRRDAGEPPVAVDAGADAAAPCQPQIGPAYILSRLEVREAGEGRDFTGDGVPDNALSVLGPFVNPGWVESITRGASIFLFQILDWDDAPSANDPDVGFVFHEGQDADSPADPSNNLTGEGRFYIKATDYDVSCQAVGRYDEARIENAVMLARTRQWRWVNPWGWTIEFTDVEGRLTFAEDYRFLRDGQVTAVWTICGLARSPFPGSTTGTVLDAVVAGFQVAPDVDVDGDGLETLQVEGGQVTGCVDGQGAVLPGADCVCDSHIADGFSVAMEFEGITATIAGIKGGT